MTRLKLASDIEENTRKQFLSDVMTVVVEGGINYWARVSNVKRDQPDLEHLSVASFSVSVIPESDEDTEPRFAKKRTINFRSIEKALALIKTGNIQINSSIVRSVIQGSADNDASDIDAACADVLIQVALFGEIIFG